MVCKMKKAQTEVFGLAVVVILIFIGIYFLTVFYKPTSGIDERIKYVDSVIAQNMLNSMLKLNTTCNLGMEDLIKDCYLSKKEGNDPWNCDGKASCVYVEKTVSNILKNTLEKWNKAYNFSIEGTGIEKTYGSCEAGVTPGSQPLPLSDGTNIKVILNICRS